MLLDHTRRFTRNLELLVQVSCLPSKNFGIRMADKWQHTDIAAVGKKVVEFYKKKGGEVVSPLVKAIQL